MSTVHVRDVWKRFRLRRTGDDTLRQALARLVGGGSVGEDFWALRGVDLAVEPGELFGIIGSNGSGKSTLLKLLTGVLKPTRGELTIQGRVGALIELGVGFHPEFSGRENIFLNGAILGLTRAEIRCRLDDIIAFAELEQFIDSPIKHYSSGMFMRLGFAIAVHVEPDVLLVDEVLAVGDEAFQRKCIGRLIRFRQEGRVVILVSHDLPMVERLCDRVAWIERGALHACGPARAVVAAYLASTCQPLPTMTGELLTP